MVFYLCPYTRMLTFTVITSIGFLVTHSPTDSGMEAAVTLGIWNRSMHCGVEVDVDENSSGLLSFRCM